MTLRQSVTVCLSLGCLVVLGLLLLVPTRGETFLPKGIFLPIAKQFPPKTSPAQVQLVQFPDVPYKKLGYIHIERNYSHNTSLAKTQIMTLANQLASTYGANGLMHIAVGVAQIGPAKVILFTALAIRQ